MPTSSEIAEYHLFTFRFGQIGEHVGIWYLTGRREEREPGQVVLVGGDLVEWFAKANIGGGGGTPLRVGPYEYTRERDGEVFASTEGPSQEWFLIPSNRDPNTFLIATEPDGRRVWTASAPGGPVRIEAFQQGGINQTFKFIPIRTE